MVIDNETDEPIGCIQKADVDTGEVVRFDFYEVPGGGLKSRFEDKAGHPLPVQEYRSIRIEWTDEVSKIIKNIEDGKFPRVNIAEWKQLLHRQQGIPLGIEIRCGVTLMEIEEFQYFSDLIRKQQSRVTPRESSTPPAPDRVESSP